MIKILSNDEVSENEILSELPFQEVNENSEVKIKENNIQQRKFYIK